MKLKNCKFCGSPAKVSNFGQDKVEIFCSNISYQCDYPPFIVGTDVEVLSKQWNSQFGVKDED
ncbi:MAG: hypothetical protein J7K40_15200 [candidate division Zixibacteria bacterium]|nr:hypothetical protein [candidate division Zixibacteria bacterium]